MVLISEIVNYFIPSDSDDDIYLDDLDMIGLIIKLEKDLKNDLGIDISNKFDDILISMYNKTNIQK